MTFEQRRSDPLVMLAGADETLDEFDAGTAYTQHIRGLTGDYDRVPLGELADTEGTTVNPRGKAYADQVFEYVDLREIDDIYGQVLAYRRVPGAKIGSMKVRFHKFDILFAKIMPSLANRKVALITDDVSNAVASTECIVVRRKPDAAVNLYYLFRVLRCDAFNRQAVARVTGATGRQRVTPSQLAELEVILPPREVQDEIGDAVEREFTLRTLAAEQTREADDLSEAVLGATALRIERLGRTVRG